MKILIVSQYFHPENFRINDFAKEFKNRGHNITVLTGIPNYPSGHFYEGYGIFKKRREIFEGIKIFRSPLIPRGSGSSLRLAINYISFVFGSIFTALFLINKKFDIIFVFEPSPITVCLPAIFLKNMGGTNDPIAFGGIDNVKTRVRAVVLSDSAYSLDAVCNILKNTARKHVPIIESLPFNSIGAFTGVIYNYQDLSNAATQQGTIWDVTVTKLMPDAKELRGLDLNVFAALVDFEIHGFGKNIT